MSIARVRAIWSGWSGAPGYSNFYVSDPETTAPDPADFRAFFAAVASVLAPGITVQVENFGPIITETTANQIGEWTAPSVTPVIATAGGNFSAPSGALVNWRTGSFIGGRRLQGRTYLVPCASAIYQSDGTLLATAQTQIVDAADALITATAGTLQVWHRPTPLGSDGSIADVTSARVPDKAVVMRSRRD